MLLPLFGVEHVSDIKIEKLIISKMRFELRRQSTERVDRSHTIVYYRR